MTHITSFWKLPIFQPQYILLTLNLYGSQDEALDYENIEAVLDFPAFDC